MIDLNELPQLAEKASAANKQLFERIRRNKKLNIDDIVHRLHTEVFEEVDCLECANCCKTIGPMIFDRDVERLAKALRCKPSQLIAQYLREDTNDYVFRTSPCPFLMSDNYCMVYTDRPKACREYPHTDRKRFRQILPITLKNTYVCPAVYLVVERMHHEIK